MGDKIPLNRALVETFRLPTTTNASTSTSATLHFSHPLLQRPFDRRGRRGGMLLPYRRYLVGILQRRLRVRIRRAQRLVYHRHHAIHLLQVQNRNALLFVFISILILIVSICVLIHLPLSPSLPPTSSIVGSIDSKCCTSFLTLVSYPLTIFCI